MLAVSWTPTTTSTISLGRFSRARGAPREEALRAAAAELTEVVAHAGDRRRRTLRVGSSRAAAP